MKKSDFLNRYYEQTELQLRTAISQWQNMPEAVFTNRPTDGGWSAAECLDHLNFYLNSYLPLIETALQQASPQGIRADYKQGWLGGWFTQLMQPDEKTGRPKKKMNSPATARPAGILKAHRVINDFIQNLERMLQAIEKARTVALSQRIPTTLHRLIRLKLGDTIAFLVAHNERHVQQAMRALGKPTHQTAVV